MVYLFRPKSGLINKFPNMKKAKEFMERVGGTYRILYHNPTKEDFKRMIMESYL